MYEEYKELRLKRINYFYEMTHQMAPDGILSTTDAISETSIKEKYGNQHELTEAAFFLN